MADTGVPTPKVTGSWLIFRDLALALAQRLESAVGEPGSSNPVLRDQRMMGRADELADELRFLAVMFDAWPASPELAGYERGTLGPRLMALQRRTEELLVRAPRTR